MEYREFELIYYLRFRLTTLCTMISQLLPFSEHKGLPWTLLQISCHSTGRLYLLLVEWQLWHSYLTWSNMHWRDQKNRESTMKSQLTGAICNTMAQNRAADDKQNETSQPRLHYWSQTFGPELRSSSKATNVFPLEDVFREQRSLTVSYRTHSCKAYVNLIILPVSLSVGGGMLHSL